MKESRIMKEIHKIREELAKLPVEKRKELFKKASIRYKELVATSSS